MQLLLHVGRQPADQERPSVGRQGAVDALGRQPGQGRDQGAAGLGGVPHVVGVKIGAVVDQVDGEQLAIAVDQVGALHGGHRRAVVGPAGVDEQGAGDGVAGQHGEGRGEQHQHEEDPIGGVLLATLGLGVLEGVLDPPDPVRQPVPQRRGAIAGDVDRAHLGAPPVLAIWPRSLGASSRLPEAGSSLSGAASRSSRWGCSR